MTRKQRKEYPLSSKTYYENVDGVMVKKRTKSHRCDTPGRFMPRNKERGSNYYDDEWPRGSFWDCPVCDRSFVFRRIDGDPMWWRLSHWNYVWWSRYRKARRSAPPPEPKEVDA